MVLWPWLLIPLSLFQLGLSVLVVYQIGLLLHFPIIRPQVVLHLLFLALHPEPLFEIEGFQVFPEGLMLIQQRQESIQFLQSVPSVLLQFQSWAELQRLVLILDSKRLHNMSKTLHWVSVFVHIQGRIGLTSSSVLTAILKEQEQTYKVVVCGSELIR